MRIFITLILLALCSLCNAQTSTTTYMVQTDTSGNYYIIRTIQTTTPSGVEAIQTVNKYPSKSAALSAAWDLVAELKKQTDQVQAALKGIIEQK